MLELSSGMTTDDPKALWHSWIINSQKHISKQDRPEREVIAFATGFEISNKAAVTDELGPTFHLLLRCILPVLIVCSVAANLIIARVAYIISQWKFPSCIYVMTLSLIDLLATTARHVDKWCQVAFSVTLLNSLSLTSEAVCSTFTISVYFFHHLASMIRSALCIELYYSFKYPLANNRKIIVSRIEHLMLLFISVLLIFNSHFLWTYSLVHMNHKQNLVPPGNYCTYLVKWVSPTFRDIFWPMLDTLIGEMFPIIAVVVSTTLVTLCAPGTICTHSFGSCSSAKQDNLERYMIDVQAFLDTRRFVLFYNVATFLVLLLPSSAIGIYKGLAYQRNHAMKVVTTFSTARSSSRSYINPADISIANTINHATIILFPLVIVALGWLFSPHGFRKEMSTLFAKPREGRKISFLI